MKKVLNRLLCFIFAHVWKEDISLQDNSGEVSTLYICKVCDKRKWFPP